MDKRSSTRRESALHNKRVERGDPDLGDCGSVLDADASGDSHELVFVNDELFGV